MTAYANIVKINRRVVAEQVIQRQDAGQTVHIDFIDGLINTSQIVIELFAGAIAVGLCVSLDHYLRTGQNNGTLFRRIGLVLAIELGVYGLAILIQIYV